MQVTSSGFFALKVPVSVKAEDGRESDTGMFAEPSGILSNDFFLAYQKGVLPKYGFFVFTFPISSALSDLDLSSESFPINL
jgi:hypothetical protein